MYGAFKWIMDRILALIALLIAFPILVILAIVVAADSPGGPFIVQKREGYKKKTIKVVKFRTMNAPSTAEVVADDAVSNEEDRITRVGRFLRRSKLDELPQLVNILKGDMSFVGPRPLIIHYAGGVEIPHRRDRGATLAVRYKQYEYWEFRKFAVLPGLTGLPQVMGNSFLSTEARSYYDVLYTEKRSLWTDFVILLKTVGVMLRGEEAFLKEPTREEIDALIDRYQSPEGVTRVAEVIGNARIGGVKAVVTNYLDHMDTSGLDIHIFTYGPSAADEHFREKGWTVHYLPNFIFFPFAKRAFRKALRAQKFDVVHSHLTSLSPFPLKVAKEQGVEVRICHAHSTTDRRELTSIVKNTLKRYAARYATDLLACSESAAKWMYGKDVERCRILKNAIDLDRYRFDPAVRDEVREELWIPEGTLTLGCVARFCYQKNIPLLLDITAEAAKSKDVCLLLVGEGKEEKKLCKKMRKLGISDRVRIVHAPENAARYYNAMDVFLLTSRYEGLGMVAVEAQANGLPCLLSDAVPREAGIGENVFFIEGGAKKYAEKICEGEWRRSENVESLRAAGYDIAEQAPILKSYYEEAMEAADERLHSGKRTVTVGKKKHVVFVSNRAPWAVITAILATDYPCEKYFIEDTLLYREMIADFRGDRPEEFDRILSMTEGSAQS